MNSLPTILAAVCTILVAACSSNSVQAPPVTGSITGAVGLILEDGGHPTDFFGTTVSIANTQLSARTDVKGVWTIANVPAGIHSLVYTRAGFISETRHGFQFIGGGQARAETVVLNAMPGFSIQLRSAVYHDSLLFAPNDSVKPRMVYAPHVALEGELTGTPNNPDYPTLTFFTSETTPARDADVPATTLANPELAGRSGSIYTWRIWISERSLLQRGKTYYIIAYPGPEGITLAQDEITTRLSPTNRTPASNELSFVIP